METNLSINSIVTCNFTSMGWNQIQTQQAEGIFLGYELVDHDNIIRPFNPSAVEGSKGIIAVMRCGYETLALYYWHKPITDLEQYNNSDFKSIKIK